MLAFTFLVSVRLAWALHCFDRAVASLDIPDDRSYSGEGQNSRQRRPFRRTDRGRCVKELGLDAPVIMQYFQLPGSPPARRPGALSIVTLQPVL